LGLEELKVAERNPLRRISLAREQEEVAGACAHHDHAPEDHFYKDIRNMQAVKNYSHT